MPRPTARRVAAAVVLTAALALALAHERRLAACPPRTLSLHLVSVSSDGVPTDQRYDAQVELHQTARDTLELMARTSDGAPFYLEKYRAAAAPAP